MLSVNTHTGGQDLSTTDWSDIETYAQRDLINSLLRQTYIVPGKQLAESPGILEIRKVQPQKGFVIRKIY